MKQALAASTALLSLSAAGAQAQSALAEAYLYDFPNFQGPGVTARESIPDLTRYNFDDKTTSIRILSGQWEVCTGVNFTGRCETVTADTWDLTGVDLNNQISAVRPARPGGYPARPDYDADARYEDGYDGGRYDGYGDYDDYDEYDDYDGENYGDGDYDDRYGDGVITQEPYRGPASLTLYQYEYFDGAEVELRRSSRDLGDQRFDDYARSLRVGEGVWRICEDAYFGGDCATVDEDVPDLDALDLDGRISSVELLSRPDYGGRPDPDGVYAPRPGRALEGYRAGFIPFPRSESYTAQHCVQGAVQACRDFADRVCRDAGYREGAYYTVDRSRGAVRDILCVRD